MNATALLADLRERGVEFHADNGRLRYRAPKGILTDAYRAALRQHRDELLALVRPAATPPADACLGCGTSTRFSAPDWPEPGAGRWLCRTCTSRPSQSLRELAAALSPADRARLGAEAAASNLLARPMLAALEEPSAPAVAAVEDAVVLVARALAADGWVAVYSAVLGAEVVFARDAAVEVPPKYADLPRFDCEELALVVAQRPDAERLRAIVEAKRAIPGTRIATGDRPALGRATPPVRNQGDKGE